MQLIDLVANEVDHDRIIADHRPQKSGRVLADLEVPADRVGTITEDDAPATEGHVIDRE